MSQQKSLQSLGHHCTILEQRRLTSEMTRCDQINQNISDQYECYLDATKESREDQACMYS